MKALNETLSFALTISFLPAQGLLPDEVRVTSRPYVVQSSTVFRVETKVVEIGAVVRDSHGRAVAGLTKENFQIHDNGKEREIADFSVDSINPSSTPATQATATDPAVIPKSEAVPKSSSARTRFIALFVDDVNAKDGRHVNDLKQTLEAAEGFVKGALQPGVQIGIFTASGTPTLDFTADPTKLIETIRNIQAHPRLSESACITPFLAYSVVVRHDSTAEDELATRCHAGPQQAEETWRRAKELSAETLESIRILADHLGTMPGGRVLLLASSGFLTGTLESQRDRIVNDALKGGVVINALDSKGVYGEMTASLDVPLVGPSASRGLESKRYNTANVGQRVETMNEPLAALAEGTGGDFFHNNNDLQAGILQLGTPPEIVYRLSFRLPDDASNGAYHKLKVTLAHVQHDSVQARPGYFAPTERSSPKAETAQSKFDQEVVGVDAVEDFPVNLSVQNAILPGGEKAFSVVANVDISKINFTKQKNRWKQTIRFVSAFRDAHGGIVAAKEATMELSLKEETYNRILKSGLNAKLTLQVPPGTYDLREVVEEAVDRKLACSTHPIEIQ